MCLGCEDGDVVEPKYPVAPQEGSENTLRLTLDAVQLTRKLEMSSNIGEPILRDKSDLASNAFHFRYCRDTPPQ